MGEVDDEAEVEVVDEGDGGYREMAGRGKEQER